MGNVGCQLDKPGKGEPQWKHCLHQSGLQACPWEDFLDC